MKKNTQRYVRNSIYAGTFLVLVGAGYLGASMRGPLQSSNSSAQPATHKLALRQESKAADSQVSNAPFRYGPEVNHGRSDTPVYNAQQALKQAKGDIAPVNTSRKPYRSRTAGRTGAEMYGH